MADLYLQKSHLISNKGRKLNKYATGLTSLFGNHIIAYCALIEIDGIDNVCSINV
jgi:hypothetical protein